MVNRFPLIVSFQPLSAHQGDDILMLVRGRGVFVYDEAGREYLDGTASFYCVALGYGEEELVAAAERQLREFPFCVTAQYRTAPVVLELAERLAALAPFPDAHVAFGTSGSEANDFLLKFVRWRNWIRGERKRTKILARVGSYHGSTLATASVTGWLDHHDEFGLPVVDVVHVPQPDRLRLAHAGEDEEAFAARMVDEVEERILTEDPETVAAFLTEPVSFSSGLKLPPAGYFDRLQAMLRKFEILFLADEVVTGFGRTGNFFGCETFGIEPDAMTLAKSMASGYAPISAVVLGRDFWEDLERASDAVGGFWHASTFGGHPVGAAVALKTIEIIERRNLVAHAREAGRQLLKGLSGYDGHPLVAEVRGVGLASALEFRALGDAESGLVPSEGPCGHFCRAAQRHGLFVRGTGDTVVVAPPLVIEPAEVDELLRRFAAAMNDTSEWARREFRDELGPH